jgi:hypothetical protein
MYHILAAPVKTLSFIPKFFLVRSDKIWEVSPVDGSVKNFSHICFGDLNPVFPLSR